jgi:alkyl hydroperoxide reductase subunit D
MMSLHALKNALPEYAKDLNLNLSTLANEQALTDQQRAGTFLAAAVAARHPCVTDAIFGTFAPLMTA